jgi:hypothetical protein
MKKKIPVLCLTLLLSAPAARAGESHISHDEYLAADVLTAIVPLGAYGLTYLKEDKPGRKQYLWSMGTSLVVVNGLRLALSGTDWATRPNGHPYGFPSGHIVFISSGAAFLQDRYGWKWGVPAWGAAYYTAWVRVEDNHHRWRDVGVAAAFSVLASQYFVSRYPDTTVKPLFGIDGMAGLQLEYRFGA